ncbi:hypothetical protein M413DRAFT_443620 [Hebeloma cylindrosporum]|uniref:Transmembrane protein n=1 Tax=Hebeloma cylindrosporum TaxID=76867 RepID=A0A0C2YRR6_HEBCY|nr:hypothetical protein M413DRAFT_443620 [Hebeloma cylindrosporum h7]
MPMYSSSIDDNDPAITYTANWYFITSDPPWTGTMHSTSTPGDQAIFRFTGSGFALICTIPTGGDGGRTRATVSIDHGPPVSVSRATTGPVQYQVVLFDSGPLAFGTHSVTITNAANEAYLRIDRIDYDPTDHTPPPPPPPTNGNVPTTTVIKTTVLPPGSSQGSGSSSSISQGAVTTTPSSGVSISVQTVTLSLTVSDSPTLLPASDVTGLSDTSTTSAKTVPTSAIAGGAVGALVLILLLVCLLIFLRRRRKRDNAQTPFSPVPGSANNLQRGNDTVPTPFQMMSYSDNPLSTASNFIPVGDRKDRGHFSDGYGASRTMSSGMSPNSPPSSTSAAPFLPSHSYSPTNASAVQSTSLDFSRSDVQSGSGGSIIRENVVSPGGERATYFPADNRNTMTSYLTEAPPPAYGDVL